MPSLSEKNFTATYMQTTSFYIGMTYAITDIQTQTQKGEIEMRRLTVIKRYYDNEFGNSHGEIRIKGKWLFQYGFKPGDKVSVIPCEGQLIILKDERG